MMRHRPEESLSLFRDVCKRKDAVVMTTCVGSLWLAASGALDGRKVTVNRPAIPVGRKMYSGTEWLDQRWVVDERAEGRCELWTSGGAFAGKSFSSGGHDGVRTWEMLTCEKRC